MKLTTYFRLQKPETTDPVNVDDLNNNADAIDSEMHDLANGANTPSFTQATTRENITAGETIAVILGKIAKFFADLKTVAFTGSFNDLTDRPTITGLQSINNDTTTVEGYVADARIAKTHGDEIDALGTRATTAEGKITALQAKSYNLANNLVTTAEGSCLDARQGKVLDDKLSTINSNLDDHTTFPSSQGGFYPDYQGGEMGYNTLESRGADTFHPFKGWKCLTDTAVSGSQTFDLTTLFPSNYQNLTVDNFIIKIDSIRATGSTKMRVEASNAGNVNFTTLMTIYTIPNKSISNNILTTSASTNGTLSASHPGDNTNTSFSSILNYKVYYLN